VGRSPMSVGGWSTPTDDGYGKAVGPRTGSGLHSSRAPDTGSGAARSGSGVMTRTYLPLQTVRKAGDAHGAVVTAIKSIVEGARTPILFLPNLLRLDLTAASDTARVAVRPLGLMTLETQRLTPLKSNVCSELRPAVSGSLVTPLGLLLALRSDYRRVTVAATIAVGARDERSRYEIRVYAEIRTE
jgi:hypothetical protein